MKKKEKKIIIYILLLQKKCYSRQTNYIYLSDIHQRNYGFKIIVMGREKSDNASKSLIHEWTLDIIWRKSAM